MQAQLQLTEAWSNSGLLYKNSCLLGKTFKVWQCQSVVRCFLGIPMIFGLLLYSGKMVALASYIRFHTTILGLKEEDEWYKKSKQKILLWVELSPCKNKNVVISAPSNSECDLTWREGHYWGNQLKMMSLGWTVIPYDWCPYRRGNLDTKTDMHRGTIIWRQHLQAKKRGLEQALPLEPSEVTNPADTSVLDSSLQNVTQ